jgi:hypothetical protein
MRNSYGISAVKALCKYGIGEVNTKLGLLEIDSEDVDWIQIQVTQDYAMLVFDPFLKLIYEIQQSIRGWGLGQPSTEVHSCFLVVVRGVSVLSSAVQCSVVTFYSLAKETEWFENRGRRIMYSV